MGEDGSEFLSRGFPATQWSLVERARRGLDQSDQREALAVLLQRYLPALRAYLYAAKRITPDAADDLLQDFVTDKIIEQKLLGRADQERGRFRALLLATLDRYLISRHRGDTAAKRAPPGGLAELGETARHVAGSGGDDPAEQFNLAWARELVAEALRRTRDECDQSHRPDLWAIFQARVVRPAIDGEDVLPYEQLVAELNLATPLQACALLTTAKRMFLRNLRALAAEYTGEHGGIEAEIADLRQILSRVGAQSGRPLRS